MNIRIALLLLLLSTFFCCKTEDEVGEETITNPNQLAVGESKSFDILSAERWNQVAVEVETGETYTLLSTGTWTDWNTVTDADGYSDPVLDVFSDLKRKTDAQWFELIVAVDTTTLYVAGADTSITFNESGSLSFFANDAEGFYGNNSDSIRTVIRRVE